MHSSFAAVSGAISEPWRPSCLLGQLVAEQLCGWGSCYVTELVSLAALDESSGPRGGSSRSEKGKHYADGFKFNFFHLKKNVKYWIGQKSVMFFSK